VVWDTCQVVCLSPPLRVVSDKILSVNQLCFQSGKVRSGKLERIFPSINVSSEFSQIHAKGTQKSFDPIKAKCCKLVQQRGTTRSSIFQALSFVRIFQQKRPILFVLFVCLLE